MGLIKAIYHAISDAVEDIEQAVKEVFNKLNKFKNKVENFYNNERKEKKAMAADIDRLIQRIDTLSDDIQAATNNSHVGAPECQDAINEARSDLRAAKTFLDNL